MPTPTETELKLSWPDAGVGALPLARALGRPPLRRQWLDATYFDTVDRLLLRRKMALRLRREGRRWVQTLKASDSGSGGLSVRSEWETPAKLVRGEPRIDLARLADSPLPRLLQKRGGTKALLAVFGTRFSRTLWQLQFRESFVEVALDLGRIRAMRNGVRVVEPISELELELKQGRVEDLVALALRLVGRGRGAPPLVPRVRSKADRGYLLASATPASPVKAGARGFVDVLAPEMASGSALRAIVAHGMQVMLANTEAMRAHDDPEYVHQARVALRRIRSAIRLLDREQADFPAALAPGLHWAAQLLGSVRDWDVLVGQTLPDFIAAEGTPSKAAALRARAERQRKKVRDAALAGLDTARFARLMLRLKTWTLTPAPQDRNLERLAPPALRRARSRLLESAHFFAALPPERQHRVRILAKRLRYALDFLSVTLPAEPTERYVDALGEMQDVLGALNDAAVALDMVRRIARSAPILDAARRWIDSRVREQSVEAERRLLALAEAATPWE